MTDAGPVGGNPLDQALLRAAAGRKQYPGTAPRVPTGASGYCRSTTSGR